MSIKEIDIFKKGCVYVNKYTNLSLVYHCQLSHFDMLNKYIALK